jgi:uncharacterized protein (TIGR02996 family)
MWNAVELDTIPGRVRAVSVPDRRQMLVVWTTDGLYGVWFARAATVLRLGSAADAEAVFDAARGALAWNEVAFALHGELGAPARRYGGTLPASTLQGDSLAFDAAGRPVGIDTAEGERMPLDDPPRAGKWFVAGFSTDGRYLLVADEWNVRLYRYAPPKGGPPARRPVTAEQQALLRAIHDEPDDDNARLVYADWLADNGRTERGEFIRLQVAHARALRADKLFAGEEREQELLSASGDLWQAEYPVIRGVTWSGFWRGFPGATALNAGTLARNAKAVWDAAPVESVVIKKLDQKGADALAKCPQLNRLRVLELRSYNSLGPAGVGPLETLLASPHLAGLWWLAFQGNCVLGLEAMERIAGSESLRGLEFLTLRWCGINDDGALALVASPHLTRLRDLDLTGNEFTGDVPSALRKRFPGVRF